ncbi:MAG: signal recognition particle protein [Alphaproteobacteria bacterium]|nr:signal recognition particle protein [Alphaproteobacteria bacterium]
MFEGLTDRLGQVFDRLKRRGALSEADVSAALREVRVALLEADVALPVVKSFIEGVREKAIGQEVLRSVTPGQMVVKIVHDHLVEILGGDAGLATNVAPPAVFLMVGLQGSGKTTTTAKLARRIAKRERKKVLVASLDVYRPAAMEQLHQLAKQVEVAVTPIVPGEIPRAIAARALDQARREGFDVLLLDTAGRLTIDEELMAEVAEIRDLTKPHEVLLVADAMTGQDAVRTATGFNERVGLTGIVLTRVDGDARGGAALSMRQVTGRPIKVLGIGEKLDQIEEFDAGRVASRILGMGDVVGLVERAAEVIEKEEAEKLAAKIQKGGFDLDDMAQQLRQLRKMGGLGGVMGMLPGIGKIKEQLAGAKVDESLLKRQEAIISSMTPKERKDARLLNASRKRRIAAGSGTTVPDINRLLKQHMEMSRVMKQMGRLGQKGLMRQGLGALFRR